MTSLYVSSPAIVLSPRLGRLGDARKVDARDFHVSSLRSELAGRYSHGGKNPRSALFAGRCKDAYYCRQVSCCAERASRFARTEKQGGIIRARSRYSAVSFLHGQCYPLLFHGRYQSYIFIVGVSHLSLASSLLSLLLARARLFPASGSYVLQLSHSFSRLTRTTYVAQILFPKDCLCERDLRRRVLRLRHIGAGMESRAKRAIANVSSFRL